MRRKLLRYESLRKLIILLKLLLLLLVAQLSSVPTRLVLVLLPMGRHATHIVVVWHD